MGRKSRLVVFDFETSGLDSDKHLAMEVAMVSCNKQDFAEELSYETLIKPYRNLDEKDFVYDPKALEIHGISIGESQEKGKSLKEVVKDIKAFLNDKRVRVSNHVTARPILCGHNVKFDVSFLQMMFWCAGEELSAHVLSNNGEIIVWDTQQIAEMLWNDDDNIELKYNLSECFARAGLGEFMAHRALPDVRSTVDLLKYMITTMRSGGTGEKVKKAEVKTKKISEPPKQRQRFQF
jgi:DNA polymerase III epsilon subunit-like protein